MFKKILLSTSVSVLLFSQVSSAQAVIELSCKAKAKEIALQTYDTCVSEKKQAHIDQIRQEYQDKLNELKKQYDTELKKMGAAINNSSVGNSMSAKIGKTSKTTKNNGKVAKILPQKSNSREALSLKNNGNEDIQESTQGSVLIDDRAEVRLTNKSQSDSASSDEMELNY